MQNYISVKFLNLSDFEDNWISPECRTLLRVCGGRTRRGRRVGCSGIWEIYFNGSECLYFHESNKEFYFWEYEEIYFDGSDCLYFHES